MMLRTGAFFGLLFCVVVCVLLGTEDGRPLSREGFTCVAGCNYTCAGAASFAGRPGTSTDGPVHLEDGVELPTAVSDKPLVLLRYARVRSHDSLRDIPTGLLQDIVWLRSSRGLRKRRNQLIRAIRGNPYARKRRPSRAPSGPQLARRRQLEQARAAVQQVLRQPVEGGVAFDETGGSLTRQLASLRIPLMVIEQPKDNHCFFHCLAQQLQDTCSGCVHPTSDPLLLKRYILSVLEREFATAQLPQGVVDPVGLASANMAR
ncbi:unnamed protein product [Vitrella brassicaformis CCMP3155]|uniref:OTU domain-containing protein n=1 Tax=Vitrella brassicaformis (strain CCMP3155) TaxID=1169540 RepID=A0A0G4EVV7_VITBC|nr:unnamed protein product [Vitrella brassicaformis CCMP3155]|eukprot:CEM02445.1 unnamed protein product [Vitrella brassicaformis CCMP3155]